uniref:Uncharacterized protein n=1 Tax=Anopheles albimanus TaxID=7167 RepID=A0A182F6N3_ANOAL
VSRKSKWNPPQAIEQIIAIIYDQLVNQSGARTCGANGETERVETFHPVPCVCELPIARLPGVRKGAKLNRLQAAKQEATGTITGPDGITSAPIGDATFDRRERHRVRTNRAKKS